jgi:hypothetical protein
MIIKFDGILSLSLIASTSSDTINQNYAIMSLTSISVKGFTSDVTDKIRTIFVCEHDKNTTTEKHGRTGYKYRATPVLNPELESKLKSGMRWKATGKTDGTCSVVLDNAIWKRRDIKPGRKIPAYWVQTGSGSTTDGSSGHLFGFMPLEYGGDKWHIDCHYKKEDGLYDMTKVWRLTLNSSGDGLEYKVVDISSLDGHSVEVMGPMWNSDPHSLTRQCVMRHGDIVLKSFPNMSDCGESLLDEVKTWFNTSLQGPYLEGVVLHLEDRSMYKIHRHHLDLPWPWTNKQPALHDIKL